MACRLKKIHCLPSRCCLFWTHYLRLASTVRYTCQGLIATEAFTAGAITTSAIPFKKRHWSSMLSVECLVFPRQYDRKLFCVATALNNARSPWRHWFRQMGPFTTTSDQITSASFIAADNDTPIVAASLQKAEKVDEGPHDDSEGEERTAPNVRRPTDSHRLYW